MKKVLILEDEVSIRSFVVINLKRAGYEVVEAGTGEEALELLKANPDVGVAILDIMLPGIDGFEVCRSIRVTDKKIGIIMLTARSQEMDKITGLMTGADDYMTKPFSPAELTARIDALYRRIDSDGSSNQIELKHGPFVLNTRNRTLDKEGRRIKLTQVEYAIVKLSCRIRAGRFLGRISSLRSGAGTMTESSRSLTSTSAACVLKLRTIPQIRLISQQSGALATSGAHKA